MSVQRNAIANSLAQLYATFVGVVMMPMYVKLMGPEAYGLVGFYTTVFSWFVLLDVGLSQTLLREVARFRGGALPALELRQLFLGLQVFFGVTAALGGLGLALAAADISRAWLNLEALSPQEVQRALALMAGVVALRWMSGPFRNALSGFERQVFLSGVNALVTTLRFVAVVPFLWVTGATPTRFFQFQLAVAALELALLAVQAFRLLPRVAEPVRLERSTLRRVLGFATTLGLHSLIWAGVVQLDRLALSRLLPLADYGYFSLAVLVASGVSMAGSPIGTAITPRLVALHASADDAAELALCRRAVQAVTVVAASAGAFLAALAHPILQVWTSDPQTAMRAAPTVAAYAVGHAFLALNMFSFYLGFARGNMRLHITGNLAFVALLVPGLLWAVPRWGAVGAGLVWLTLAGGFFFLWMPLVLRRFLPRLLHSWFGRDTLPIALAAGAAALACRLLLPPLEGRWLNAGALALCGAVVFLAATAASSEARRWMSARFAGAPS